MANEKDVKGAADAASATTTEPKYFTVEDNVPMPENGFARASKGIPALLKSMKIGGSFPVPRPGGKRDNSKFAGITRAAKKLGIYITTMQIDEFTDRVWRVDAPKVVKK